MHALTSILPIATSSVHWFTGWKFTGNFTTVDLIAASTNALNGALLARRPDHFKNFTIVGVLGMALLMGLGGGITRDVLVNQVPSALPIRRISRSRSGSVSSATCSRSRKDSCFARGCFSS